MVWFGSGDYGFGLATYLLILLGPCRTCEEEQAAPSSGSGHDMRRRVRLTWHGLVWLTWILVWFGYLPADTAGPCRTCVEEQAAPSSGSGHDMKRRVGLTWHGLVWLIWLFVWFGSYGPRVWFGHKQKLFCLSDMKSHLKRNSPTWCLILK